jgi:3-mercaptopyruvate sulfurtransferase SseA
LGLILIASAVGWAQHSYSESGLLARPAATANVQQAYGHDLVPKVSAEELDKLLQSDVVVIDARSEEQFRKARLPGAINVPATLDEDQRHAAMRGIPLDARLVIYCDPHGCPLSEKLGVMLIQDGYDHVFALKGNWDQWSVIAED